MFDVENDRQSLEELRNGSIENERTIRGALMSYI